MALVQHVFRYLTISSEFNWYLSGQVPPYLADDIHLVSEGRRRRLHSSTDRSCAVPCTHNTFGNRSFAAAGLRVWNSLPVHKTFHITVFRVNWKRFGF